MNAKLDLNDAALLVRVIQTRSFSAAAREAGVPVSTVSRRITRLETVLATRLLERTTRSLRLTEAGRSYFAHAERAVADLSEGSAAVRDMNQEPSGRVRILCPLAFSPTVSAAVIEYLAAYPNVAIDLELADRNADLDAFDLAFVTGRVGDSNELIARPLQKPSRKLLVASPAYLKARGTPRRFADLAKHALISTRATEGITTWTLVHKGKKRRLAFQPRLMVSEYSAAYRACIAGLGISLVPESTSAPDLAKKRLVQVLPSVEGETGGVYLVYRAHRSFTAAVRTCIDHLMGAMLRAWPTSRSS
ncbi:MAG TPA: LysR family transcriptional regulator [Kofleriaceae bacterium]